MTSLTTENSSSSNMSGSVEMMMSENVAKELRTGPVRDWLRRLAGSAEIQLSSSPSSSAVIRGSLLSRFIQQASLMMLLIHSTEQLEMRGGA